MISTASTTTEPDAQRPPSKARPLIYRQFAWTRITHWIWAVALFFLLLSGLQIFNAHPTLYVGDQSGFAFDNAVLAMRAENTAVRAGRLYARSSATASTRPASLACRGSGDQPVARGFPGLGDDPVRARTWRRAASCTSSLPGCW